MSMKADDPLVHQQLQYLATQGRKSVQAKVVVVVASAWDPDRKAKSNLVTFDTDGDDNTMQEKMATLTEVLAVALGNVIANSTLELILRDKKTGEELDPMKMTFGRTVGEVDP